MKILQLTVHYAPNIGGVETHLTDLVSELAARKHTVFVLTYRPLVAKTSWKMVERFRSATILRLPWLPGFFYKFNTSPIVEFLYLVPGLFVVTPAVLLFFRPQVIHAHGLIAGFIGVFWGKVFRKRVVVSTHSLYHFPGSGLYYRFVHWIFNRADLTLCLSKQSAKEIAQLGVPQKKIKQFTYWINTDVFKPQPSKKEKFGWMNRFVVLFVGRLIQEKGIRELLEASKQLDASFLVAIIGDGPMAQEIKQKADESNGVVSFVHKIDNTQLPVYYSSSDILIVPSVHEEGFGRVILESLACGIPVMAANRGAIPEALDSSVGELINITPENIAKHLKALQKDQTRLHNMAKEARKFALKNYSKGNVEEIIETYAEK